MKFLSFGDFLKLQKIKMNVSSECHNAMNICAVLLFWSNIENSISFCSSFCKRRDDFSSVAVPSKTEKEPMREVQMQLDK